MNRNDLEAKTVAVLGLDAINPQDEKGRAFLTKLEEIQKTGLGVVFVTDQSFDAAFPKLVDMRKNGFTIGHHPEKIALEDVVTAEAMENTDPDDIFYCANLLRALRLNKENIIVVGAPATAAVSSANAYGLYVVSPEDVTDGALDNIKVKEKPQNGYPFNRPKFF